MILAPGSFPSFPAGGCPRAAVLVEPRAQASPRPTVWGRADPLTKFGLCAFMLDPEEIITSKSGYCRRPRDAALLQQSPPVRRIFHQQRQKKLIFLAVRKMRQNPSKFLSFTNDTIRTSGVSG